MWPVTGSRVCAAARPDSGTQPAMIAAAIARRNGAQVMWRIGGEYSFPERWRPRARWTAFSAYRTSPSVASRSKDVTASVISDSSKEA